MRYAKIQGGINLSISNLTTSMPSLNTKQFTTYVQTRKQANREPIVITSCDDGSYIEFVGDR